MGLYRVVSLIFGWQLAASICYYAVFAATPFFRDEFGLSGAAIGFVVTALTLGYALFLLPLGVVTDRYGERRTLTLGLCGLAVGTVLVAASWSYLSLLFAVFLLGSVYGTAMPGTNKAIFDNTPVDRQNLAVGIKQVGVTAGSGASALVVTGLTGSVVWYVAGRRLTWEVSFLLVGALGAVVAVAFWFLYRPATTSEDASIPEFRTLLSNRPYRALTAAGVCIGTGVFTTTGYTVLYIDESVGATVAYGGLVLAGLQLSGSVGRVVTGWLSDTVPGEPRRAIGMILLVQCLASGLLFGVVAVTEGVLLSTGALLALGFFALGSTGVYYSCMASLIPGITYVDVIVAGLIPATILSLTIFVAVHYVSAPQLDNTSGESLLGDKLPRSEFLSESLKYGIPLAVLIYKLGIQQVTVGTAALWTTAAMLLTGILFPIAHAAAGTNEETPVGALKRTLWETLDGCREGVVVLAPVAIILAAINGVVDILTATGVPTAISLTLLDLSGGVLIVAAILSMIICIILGLGMPTTASYTIVALLVAPTLISQFFLPELASHFFVFYAAILAGLTPPIATCVAVACGIAGADFWRSCVEAIKISAPLFVLPFVFIYHPDIVSAELNMATAQIGILAMLGAVAIIHGINFPFRFDSRAQVLGARVVFFVGGVITMVYPTFLIQAAAVGVLAILYGSQVATGQASLRPAEAEG